MLRNIAYLVFCLHCVTTTAAQQVTNINSVLENIRNDLKTLYTDTAVTESCRKSIKELSPSFSGVSAKDFTAQSVTVLTKSIEKLEAVTRREAVVKCYGAKVKQLLLSRNNLKTELKKQVELFSKQKDSVIAAAPAKDTATNKSLAVTDSNEVVKDSAAEVVTTAEKKETPEPVRTNSTWLLVSAVVGLILVVWVISRHQKTVTNNTPVVNELSDQAATMENKEPVLESTNMNNEPVLTDQLTTEQPGEPLYEEPITEQEVVVPVIPVITTEPAAGTAPKESSHYFICEVMMTAGPRKKFMSEENADKDLGEDVCGFVLKGDEVFIWLLDGTSDLHCLKHPVSRREYFSSRLLAQSVAQQLRKYFVEQPAMPFTEMILPAIREVRSGWLQEIELLPDAEKQVLRNVIENRNLPECATTLLIASLKLNGDFNSYRTGDSKLFLFDAASDNGVVLVQTLLQDKNEKSNDRIFFRLWINDQGAFDILFNEPLHETESKKNIGTIISFSDGIGAATEQLLREEYKTKPDKVRKEIIYQAQETGDDKSIYFIEIKASQ